MGVSVFNDADYSHHGNAHSPASYELDKFGRHGRARRCLFGSVNHAEARNELNLIRKRLAEESNNRWGFDFETGRPTKTHGGRYLWIDNAENVTREEFGAGSKSTEGAVASGLCCFTPVVRRHPLSSVMCVNGQTSAPSPGKNDLNVDQVPQISRTPTKTTSMVLESSSTTECNSRLRSIDHVGQMDVSSRVGFVPIGHRSPSSDDLSVEDCSFVSRLPELNVITIVPSTDDTCRDISCDTSFPHSPRDLSSETSRDVSRITSRGDTTKCATLRKRNYSTNKSITDFFSVKKARIEQASGIKVKRDSGSASPCKVQQTNSSTSDVTMDNVSRNDVIRDNTLTSL